LDILRPHRSAASAAGTTAAKTDRHLARRWEAKKPLPILNVTTASATSAPTTSVSTPNLKQDRQRTVIALGGEIAYGPLASAADARTQSTAVAKVMSGTCCASSIALSCTTRSEARNQMLRCKVADFMASSRFNTSTLIRGFHCARIEALYAALSRTHRRPQTEWSPRA
jgi:hypothetical protein